MDNIEIPSERMGGRSRGNGTMGEHGKPKESAPFRRATVAQSAQSRNSKLGEPLGQHPVVSWLAGPRQPTILAQPRTPTPARPWPCRSRFARTFVITMSSALLKGKLKAARDALNKKDYHLAHDTSLQILEYEPENYNAYVYRCAAIPRFDSLQ